MKTEMLVLSDDFTGALDTGIQFAKNGISTKVFADPDCDFEQEEALVLVIDTETRHVSAQRAGEIIGEITRRACNAGIPIIYKKTDSALRGNAGAELGALYENAGLPCIHFLPALPAMNRSVKDGVLYIDGVKVNESVFGRDPFEPVRWSKVSDIIADGTTVPVHVCDNPEREQKGIIVYNGSCDEDIDRVLEGLKLSGQRMLLAGCAGLASRLSLRMGKEERAGVCSTGEDVKPEEKGFLVVCGSVNQVTRNQIAAAKNAGFGYERLDNCRKLTDYLFRPEGRGELEQLLDSIEKSSRFIIDTNDEAGCESAALWGEKNGIDIHRVGSLIADTLSNLVRILLEEGIRRMILLTGGDVLFHTMKCMGVRELMPLSEVSPGVVLSCFMYEGKRRYVLTKSGGFGDEDVLVRLGEKYRFSSASSGWKPY